MSIMGRKDNNIKKNRHFSQKNKNGIPIFDSSENFSSLFMGRKKHKKKGIEHLSKKHFLENSQQACSTAIVQEENNRPGRCRKKDKHGINILDHSKGFTRIFLQNNEKNNKDNFSKLLNSSLKGKTMQAMMREKKDKPKPATVPLKKRLKRYPPPQKLLDLHGDTASMAETRADSYIRTCGKNGIFTLRIVVGKGLHSEYGAVLPDIIEDLLIKLKKEEVVLWFKWDRKKKSSSGSLIVYLKQFNDGNPLK